MKKWRCMLCGYVHNGDSPPERCPVCGATKDKFILIEQDDANDERDVRSYSADVLVVGSGAAAFSAAVTARERGASVIMLEKARRTGGTTARSGGGFWTPGNHRQEALGYRDNREDCLRYMARYSYPHLYNEDAPMYGIPKREFELLEAYVDNAKKMAAFFDALDALKSIEEINWTGKPQVDYMDHLPENKGIRGRTLYPRGKDGNRVPSGAELIRQLEAWARAQGVEIVTDARVTSIIRNPKDGRVSGLEAVVHGEKQVFAANQGVIFGSGGYSHDAERMLQWQRGPHYGGCSVPTNTGDFIGMAGTIGAQMGNTPGAFRAQSMIEVFLDNPSGSSNVFYLIGDSMLLVNKYGKRVMDEKRNYNDRTMLHFVWDPVNAEWSNMLTFLLFDQRCLDLWQGFPPFPVGGKEASYLIRQDTLSGIAKEIEKRLDRLSMHTGGFSLDKDFLDALQTTVREYNDYARDGVDTRFHRGENAYDLEWTTFPPTNPNAKWPPDGSKNISMYPLADTGPYYAIILAAGTLDTNGGPVIDRNGRVLGWDGAPIPGLYGAGNCIASPTANAYWGAGATIGSAMTFGYLAALHCTGA